MKIEQAKQIASKAIEELIHALEAGHSERLRKYLAALARFHRYSLHNVMLIASQRPDATRVAGFHTWKQLGRFVKKGAKGIVILAPVVVHKDSAQDQKDETNESMAIRFRAAYVFEMADTDGKSIPQLGNTEGAPSDRTERLKEFVASRGIQLEYSDTIYPARGQCAPGKIVILPGQAAAEEFATLVHEAAHALLQCGPVRAGTSTS
jgi:antirestriction protein ArdC